MPTFRFMNRLLSVGFGVILAGLPVFAKAEPADDVAARPDALKNIIKIKSPDGRIKLCFGLAELDARTGSPQYWVARDGKLILAPSSLGFEYEGGAHATPPFVVLASDQRSQDAVWRPVYGERAEIRDHFNELTVRLEQTTGQGTKMELVFRAYDTGVAFCYRVSGRGEDARIRIRRERTEFRFTGNHEAWAVYSAQGVYAKVTLDRVKAGCERPLVVQVGGDCFAAVAEARLVDYARMKLGPLDGVPHALVSVLDGPVESALPLRTPWRVIMLADTPAALLQGNDLIMNLNDPCAITDTSWIKPGKVIREVTLTTTGGKACVDFALRGRFQFVEFDAGWYGPEGDDASDATTVTLDPRRSNGPLDLPEVIRYAQERGVGIILYVNQRALTRQLDTLLPLFRQWGVKGVKYGFVNVGSQSATIWLHDAVRKAAEHQLMVDIHDEYRPTGFSRTYPNLMTQEGIRGDEERQPPTSSLVTLFTRMLAGAGDNTICYFDSRVRAQANHAYQLAKTVCFYSPWQFHFWYDRPPKSPRRHSGAGAEQNLIIEVPELQFFEQIPTVWDDTLVLQGDLGEYAVVARRNGQKWFLGAMNAETARMIKVPLSFLGAAGDWTATVYVHDVGVGTPTQVGIVRKRVTAETAMELDLSPNDGAAVVFER